MIIAACIMMIIMFLSADSTIIMTGGLTEDLTEGTIEGTTEIFMTTLGDIINTLIVTDTEDAKILFGGCSGPYFSDRICKLANWDIVRPSFILKIDAFTRKPFIFRKLYGNIIILFKAE